MDYILDSNMLFSQKERCALIRYCICSGDRAKCATMSLLRPFKLKFLTSALSEREKFHRSRIESFRNLPNADQSRRLVKQERECLRILKSNYTISVDYAFKSKQLLAFHNSLNPRVTFGYSSLLHEECDFPLDEKTKAAFLSSSLKNTPQSRAYENPYDWGLIAFGKAGLIYEDLTVFRGNICILETITHEDMMTVRLKEDDLAFLSAQKGGSALVKKLRGIEK